MQDPAIPRFFLYGEPPQRVGERFLHLEALADRARPANWNIRPHAHGGLSHLLLIEAGGGVMAADATALRFSAPCLLAMPASVVHAFQFEEETRGAVLTLSDAYREALTQRAPELAQIFARPRVLPVPDGRPFAETLSRLGRELNWTAPGHAAAVEALLTTVLVDALRIAREAELEMPARQGRHAELVARFRALVEARYRSQARVEAYAEALFVNAKRLRAACLRIAGATPGRILQDRLMLEAKRILLYTDMSVSETAYYLGYDDPAYFTRAFTRNAGASPRTFRNRPEARPDESGGRAR